MNRLAILSMCFLLSGCAFTRDHISLDYKPTITPEKISDAKDVRVAVDVVDARLNKEAVGCKKNGYGVETAYIVADNDVTEILRNAVISELDQRGFTISEGENKVEIELCKFFNDFKVGFFSGGASSEALVTVVVKNEEGQITYTKTVMGLGVVETCFLANGKNAALALESALHNTVQTIVNDPNFIAALTGQPQYWLDKRERVFKE